MFKHSYLYLCAFLSTWALVLPTFASESAAEILKKADKAAYTKTSKVEIVQVVITPSGEKRSFKMLSYTYNGAEKGLTEYLEPNRVRGMKILTLNDGDDIWTYFPRTNRTRKIASSARNRRVQGSDFTYDDMATGKLAEDWKGTVSGTEKINGQKCYKLTLKPTPSGPQSYSHVVAWVNQKNYTVLRIEYWDNEGERIKRLDIGDYREISKVLIPFKYAMTNLIDGGKTLMKVNRAEVNLKLASDLFAEASLSN